MEAITPVAISVESDELALLRELLDSERNRLLVEIRHTDHRTYRDQLRQRLEVVERLMERCGRA
ncbi:MAG: hypothetical protein ACE141_06445 [Bryobacteraceae bacterium]